MNLQENILRIKKIMLLEEPTNGTVASIMKKLIPKGLITSDGWLQIKIPVDKLNNALVQLHNNKGTSAEINARGGVNIKLIKI